MSCRYSSFEMRKAQGAVHWRIEARRQGRNHFQRGSSSTISSEQVRNLKIFCRTWTAPLRAPAQANGRGGHGLPPDAQPLAFGRLRIGNMLQVAQDLLEHRRRRWTDDPLPGRAPCFLPQAGVERQVIAGNDLQLLTRRNPVPHSRSCDRTQSLAVRTANSVACPRPKGFPGSAISSAGWPMSA